MEAKNNISICTAKIEEKSQRVSDLKQQLRELNTKIKINDSELKSIKDIASYQSLIDSAEKLEEEIEGLTKYKNELSFRADPMLHYEEFKLVDTETGVEL